MVFFMFFQEIGLFANLKKKQ